MSNICEYPYQFDLEGLEGISYPDPPATANSAVLAPVPGMPQSTSLDKTANYNNGPPDYIIKKRTRQNAYGQSQTYARKRGYASSSYGARNQGKSLPPRFSQDARIKKEVLFRGE